MEGLIPFLYRAIVHYKNCQQQPLWLCESPSVAYMKLPGGDSGRIFWSEYNFSMSPSRTGTSGRNDDDGIAKEAATTQVIVASGARSPARRRAVG
ncbi:hypothetical protein MLD38_038405 [Melastoma candidum]|uniref:Uncharacterized protein n=1 Tax=Melastoma candidum TaxID=119954 RepID=A0ACB9KZT8_9MYRT|nr:hypothetical protein MLD38_038405 [Melastoma candidum]